jgi:hypothetical protein
MELSSYPHSQSFGQVHTIFHGDAMDGHKRNHIRRADAGMSAQVLSEIDEVRRDACALKRRFTDGIRISGKRQHRPMVVGVHFFVQEKDARDRSNRSHQRTHRVHPTPFAEIWDTPN